MLTAFSQLGPLIIEKMGQEFDYLALTFSGEQSDFCRFNHAKIRQLGRVEQNTLLIKGVKNEKSIKYATPLRGKEDLEQIFTELKLLSQQTDFMEKDPGLFLPKTAQKSSTIEPGEIASEPIIKTVLNLASSSDFVGFLASGRNDRAFLDSVGTVHEFSIPSFSLDWCLYLRGDIASKNSYGGFVFDEDTLAHKLREGHKTLEALKKERIALPKGTYRAYLAPEALQEILSLLAYQGFSEWEFRHKTSPLMALYDGRKSLHPSVSLHQDLSQTPIPPFNQEGVLRPQVLPLMEQGKFAGSLVSERTAKLCGIESNGADLGEVPEALTMGAGSLAADEILRSLDHGIYLQNLWYTNYSDHDHCKVTGMTRFACFLVENGEIKAPIKVMRFDESLYELLGEHLEQLSEQRELLLDSGTYQSRHLGAHLLPGALVQKFHLTL